MVLYLIIHKVGNIHYPHLNLKKKNLYNKIYICVTFSSSRIFSKTKKKKV